MKKARKGKMLVLLGILLIIIGVVLVWFHIPFSSLKKTFSKDIKEIAIENHLESENEVFTKEEFSHLPTAIQKYVEHCGYIGTPKKSYLKMEYYDVDFMQGRKGPALNIDYIQYDFVKEPCRMAFIDSSMFGIPFEGCDYYRNGVGGMKGVVGKAITIFNVTGPEMDKACLATFLAESVFLPNIFLQDYITFEEVSEFEVKAKITYGGQTADGIFTFNEDYEMTSFITYDRGVTNEDGTLEYVPWSALCSDYQKRENGIMYPTKFQAVWNYPDEAFVYFDGVIREVSYGE